MIAGARNGEVLLSVKDVSRTLSGVPILRNLSFDVVDRIRPGAVTGQVVGLLGPSGVGKTRLFRIIAGLDRADTGSVLGIKGVPLSAGQVGVVFQNYPLLRHRTVLGNLVVAGIANGLSTSEAKQRSTALLQRFGLAERAGYYPGQLSGGQRQRVAIAQQIVVPKTFLLMDEPFSGLDPQVLHEVIDLIVEVANMDELNTILIVTHDIWSAMVASDTILMLGRERTPDGRPLPGARIQVSYDLVERGLAWRKGVEQDPGFTALEREIRDRFKTL
jgi:polar amino acid transport system ATP-binding protein/sulfate transport system ATP-binding protein